MTQHDFSCNYSPCSHWCVSYWTTLCIYQEPSNRQRCDLVLLFRGTNSHLDTGDNSTDIWKIGCFYNKKWQCLILNHIPTATDVYIMKYLDKIEGPDTVGRCAPRNRRNEILGSWMSGLASNCHFQLLPCEIIRLTDRLTD